MRMDSDTACLFEERSDLLLGEACLRLSLFLEMSVSVADGEGLQESMEDRPRPEELRAIPQDVGKQKHPARHPSDVVSKEAARKRHSRRRRRAARDHATGCAVL